MKGYITAKDIKNFIFQQKDVSDKMFSEYLNQFGMKIDDKLNYDDFVFLIRGNKKLNDYGGFEKIETHYIKSYNTTTDSCKNLNFDIED